MNILTNYVRFTLLLRFLFIVFAFMAFRTEAKLKNNPSDMYLVKEHKQYIYIRNHLELLFKFCIALLLIYLFNPMRKEIIPIGFETRVLLYLFGILILLTADWRVIIDNKTFDKYVSFMHNVVA